ncbi:MAG: hypothetical protein AAGJ18_03380 [Bacteroidota bacterium]
MRYFYFLLLPICFYNCAASIEQQPNDTATKTFINSIETDNYELFLPTIEQKGVLILFPGFPETPTVIQREFKIAGPALNAGVAVVLMKFNQRLWLETDEKFRLTKIINDLHASHNLSDKKVYIGGFSAGGNISLLFANHLVQTQNIIQPKGVFSIDAPVDLQGLYEVAQRNIERNFTKISVQESEGIFRLFHQKFGQPLGELANYEDYSPFTKKTSNIQNLAHLKSLKIRLYTEPDVEWWQKNRQNDWEDMNAFYIKHLADKLRQRFSDQVEYIPTKNRGYRANGQRHPHSWAIVEVNDLLEWMLED